MKPTALAALMLLFALLLAACGTAAPPSPVRSEREQQQTNVALSGRPTLAPLPSGPAPTPEPGLATQPSLPSSAPAPAPAPTPEPGLAALFAITDNDPRAIGNPNAPILIIEFTDFE